MKVINSEWSELGELSEWGALGEWSELGEWRELCEVNRSSRVSLAQGILRAAWCLKKFQYIICVIHDVTLLDTENRKRHR